MVERKGRTVLDGEDSDLEVMLLLKGLHPGPVAAEEHERVAHHHSTT